MYLFTYLLIMVSHLSGSDAIIRGSRHIMSVFSCINSLVSLSSSYTHLSTLTWHLASHRIRPCQKISSFSLMLVCELVFLAETPMSTCVRVSFFSISNLHKSAVVFSGMQLITNIYKIVCISHF